MRGYRRDWRDFAAWCAARDLAPLPAAPEAVGAHLAALADAGRALATLRRRLAAVARAHRAAGFRLDTAHPAVRETLRGIARMTGRPPRRAAALCAAEVKAIAAACDTSSPPESGGKQRQREGREGDTDGGRRPDPAAALAALRDRALVLFGYASALRRSELAVLQVEHLVFGGEGVRVLVPRSKTDAQGAGAEIFVARGDAAAATCPVAALEAWLAAARLGDGPVWRAIHPGRRSALRRPAWPWRTEHDGRRVETKPPAPPPRVSALGRADPARGLSGEAIRLILRRRAAAAGVAGTSLEPVSPHGLRAGFVTEAYRAGVPDEAIMGHTRHRDLASMRRYVRRARLEADTPTRKIGL